MTLFEKNLDVDTYQPGLPDLFQFRENDIFPDIIDLSFLKNSNLFSAHASYDGIEVGFQFNAWNSRIPDFELNDGDNPIDFVGIDYIEVIYKNSYKIKPEISEIIVNYKIGNSENDMLDHLNKYMDSNRYDIILPDWLIHTAYQRSKQKRSK